MTEARKRRRRRDGGFDFASGNEERSALDQYLREVSLHELLTGKEEIELAALRARVAELEAEVKPEGGNA